MKALVLAIRPRFTDSILDGTKTVELRRSKPRVESGHMALIYACAPVKAIVGGFVIDGFLTARPDALWTAVKGKAAVTYEEFKAYFKDCGVGHAISIRDPWRARTPVPLEVLRTECPSFHPPRSYGYISLSGHLASLLGHNGSVGPSQVEVALEVQTRA